MLCDDAEISEKPIMPVSAKIIFWGVELGWTMTNTTSTIKNSSTIILPPNIWCRIGTLFLWMTHGWIFPTLRSQKIATISPRINFMGGKVGGSRSHNNFTITNTNIKRRTTQSTTWILISGWWFHWGWCTMTMSLTKSPIMPVFFKFTFLGV